MHTQDSYTFRGLGSLGAFNEGQPVLVGPRRQRAVLAALLCRRGQFVSAETVMSDVWGEHPPKTGRKVLPTYICRLRQLLTPETIRTVDGGYQIVVDEAHFDVARFDRLLDSANTQLSTGQHAMALDGLRHALSLWKGDPFLGLSGPLLVVERRRLVERRLRAAETCFELEVSCGNAGTIIEELHALHLRYPFRERLAAAWIRALVAEHRTAEALYVFVRVRALLARELGVDPGPELRAAHLAALDHELTTERNAAGSSDNSAIN